ncbi:MAG: DUF5615 family PIN-like protein [Bacteroidota bacterium]
MSEITFYLDEHIPRAVASGLRRRGVSAITLPEAGMLGASDEEHLAYAREHGLVIVTQDADFLRLAGGSSDHGGIVYGRPGREIGQLVRALVLIAEVLTREEMKGQVEFA